MGLPIAAGLGRWAEDDAAAVVVGAWRLGRDCVRVIFGAEDEERNKAAVVVGTAVAPSVAAALPAEFGPAFPRFDNADFSAATVNLDVMDEMPRDMDAERAEKEKEMGTARTVWEKRSSSRRKEMHAADLH